MRAIRLAVPLAIAALGAAGCAVPAATTAYTTAAHTAHAHDAHDAHDAHTAARPAAVCPNSQAERAGVILEHANGKQSMPQWLAKHPGQFFSDILTLTITCGGPGGQGWWQKSQAIWSGELLVNPKVKMPKGMEFYAARPPFGSP